MHSPLLIMLLLGLPLLWGCDGCSESNCNTRDMPNPLADTDLQLTFGPYQRVWQWTFVSKEAGDTAIVVNAPLEARNLAYCECYSCGCKRDNIVKLAYKGAIHLYVHRGYYLSAHEQLPDGNQFWSTHDWSFFSFRSHSLPRANPTAYGTVRADRLASHTVPAGTFADVWRIYPAAHMDTLYWSFYSGPVQYTVVDTVTQTSKTYVLANRFVH